MAQAGLHFRSVRLRRLSRSCRRSIHKENVPLDGQRLCDGNETTRSSGAREQNASAAALTIPRRSAFGNACRFRDGCLCRKFQITQVKPRRQIVGWSYGLLFAAIFRAFVIIFAKSTPTPSAIRNAVSKDGLRRPRSTYPTICWDMPLRCSTAYFVNPRRFRSVASILTTRSLCSA
jgi:hypothetical protein